VTTDEEYAAAIEADWHRPPRPRTLFDLGVIIGVAVDRALRALAGFANPDYSTDEQYAERMLREHKRAVARQRPAFASGGIIPIPDYSKVPGATHAKGGYILPSGGVTSIAHGKAIIIRTNPNMPPDELARTVAAELRGQVL
jgi:hypothetical protein